MKRKFFSLSALFAAVLTLGSVSFAQESTTTPETPKMERGAGKFGGRWGGKMHGGKILRLMNELNLSEAQKQQVKILIDTNQAATQTQREEMRQIWSQKRDGGTLTSEQENRAREIASQLREISQKLHEDLLAVLTPEQKAQLEQKRQEMRQRKMERRQMKQNSPTPTEPQR